MGDDGSYQSAQSTVHRLKNRGHYDHATIHSLIDSCPVLHVSFNAPAGEDPFPITLPMLGVTGNFSDPYAEPNDPGPRSIYLHGHSASRLMKAPTTAQGTDTTSSSPSSPPSEDGIPCCVAATFIDGLVLSYTPFHNSCNYRSAVCFGRAVAVTDERERVWAMQRITDNMLPERWAQSREPSAAEYKSTGILRVEIVSASAKIRVGTNSEDRHDLKDDALRERTWVGTIPMSLAYGQPVAGPDNRFAGGGGGGGGGGVPEYIDKFVGRQNEEAKAYAEEAIQKGKK